MSQEIQEERRDEARPVSGEAPFNPGEVFFSRTDKRGVIKTGNYVFRRVADYDWDELIGAPHKIVRHPDMPKGVFHLFWQTIGRGEAIGAYVKNLAKDGLHYWVFAVALPLEDGYLSARIKPTSPLLAQIGTIYADLLAAETAENLTPAESTERLLSVVQSLGFSGYADFATHALCEELIARDRILGAAPDQTIARSRSMLEAADKLGKATQTLIAEFSALSIVPHNMRVMASRLEPSGGPFSTLSKNYGSMSKEMSDWFETHVVGPESNFATIRQSINDALFLVCTAGILGRCDDQLESERRMLGSIELDAERELIHRIVSQYLDRSEASSVTVNREARRIQTACQDMHRHIMGLGTTRIACKIENARMTGHGRALDDIVEKLRLSQERIEAQLSRISDLSQLIVKASAETLGRDAA